MANQISPEMVTTGFDLPGYRVAKNLGVVRGITVRSRSALGNLAGGIQAIFGGNITIYTELCEHARAEAFDLMIRHAQEHNANAIIGVRYDANEVMEGITEVLAYGTAVITEKM
ncbi:MAG: YbjQ family protein [Chloroflexi bacterium]|nr:YbjQ family protein [Chloroflexota bacterium]